MRGLDLFSGIGTASLAMQAAGIEIAAHSEIEPFPCAVLEYRFPGVPNLGDVSKIAAEQLEDLGEIDVVSFGSPCQDWSVAGKRLGLKGHRSSLFHEAVRIIRLCRPRFAVFENVPGLFSSAGGWDFAAVLDEMEESGALDLAWSVLDAQWFGVPQRRRRIFLIADFTGERAGEILSIEEGVYRDTAPSREAGEEATRGSGDGFAFALRGRDEGARVEVSGDRTSSIRGEGGSGRDYVAAPSVGIDSEFNADEEKIGAIRSHQSGGAELFVGTFQNTGHGWWNESSVRQTIRTPEGGGSLEANLVGEIPAVDDGAIIAFSSQDNGRDATLDLAPTLRVGTGLDISSPPAVAFAENQRGELRTSECHPQLTSGGGKPGQGYPAVAQERRVDPTLSANEGGTLTQIPPVTEGMAVRRLTPLECERLQGLPDGWTDVPFKGKPAPDSARYRALGNAWALPVGEWVMKGITGVER